MLWKRSLRLEAVYKFWRMISKSIQLMSICSTVNRELQGIHIGGSSSFIGGKNVLNMCDLFEDDYKEFVLGELTELWDSYY